MTSGAAGDSRLADLRRNYRTTFLRYLPSRSEHALAAAYELGREALAGGISVLDLVRIHHEVLADTINSSAPDEITALIDAAADFLAETLGATDMAQRSIHSAD